MSLILNISAIGRLSAWACKLSSCSGGNPTLPKCCRHWTLYRYTEDTRHGIPTSHIIPIPCVKQGTAANWYRHLKFSYELSPQYGCKKNTNVEYKNHNHAFKYDLTRLYSRARKWKGAIVNPVKAMVCRKSNPYCVYMRNPVSFMPYCDIQIIFH